MTKKLTALDTIVIAFKNNAIDDLPEVLKKELERWSMADDLIRTYKDTKAIITILCDRFKISMATAYRDIGNAKRLFGSIRITDKDYYKDLYAEQLEEYAKLSAVKHDYKTATLALKEAAEIRGLKDGDAARDLYIDLEPSKFILVINVQQSEGARNIEIDFDRMEDVEDVDFELVESTLNNTPSVSESQMQKMLDENR